MVALLRDIDLATAIGWALVHAPWQGAIVWGVYQAVVLCGAQPTLRCIVGNACILAFVAAQLTTVAYCVVADVRPELLDELSFLSPGHWAPAQISDGVYRVRSMPLVSNWTRLAAIAVPWLPLLCLGWGIESARRVFVSANTLLALRRELGRCRELSDTLRAHANRACECLRLRRPVRFLQSAQASVPATAGWLKPVVLVPENPLELLAPDHFEAMLVHELAHVERADYLYNLLRSWVEAAYFFHPLLRRLVRELDVVAEQATDDRATAALGSKKTYAAALLTLEERRPAVPGTLGMEGGPAHDKNFGGQIGTRIRNLHANHATPGLGRRRLSVAGPFLASLLLVAVLSQTLAAAAGDRMMATRARGESLAHAVLADLSDDRDNPAAEAALARAVADVRAGGAASAAALDTLASELLSGVRADLLTDLRGLSPDEGLVRGLAPDVVATLGSAQERAVLVRQFREASRAVAGRERQRASARAALCLACLDRATLNGGGRTFLLLQPDFLATLHLTAGQQRRFDLAARAENERGGQMMAMLLALRAAGHTPTRRELSELCRIMSLSPGLQTATARCLPLHVHRALRDFVRQDPAAPSATSLARMLCVADVALAAPAQYVPSRIDLIPSPRGN